MKLTLDSNILVYALAPPLHERPLKRRGWKELSDKACILFEGVIRGNHQLIIPYCVLVEVAAVIAVLTGDEEKGKEAARKVVDNADLILYDRDLMGKALDYAVKIKASGFDSLIATTAIIGKATLFTNDGTFYQNILPFASEYEFDVKFFRELEVKEIVELP